MQGQLIARTASGDAPRTQQRGATTHAPKTKAVLAELALPGPTGFAPELGHTAVANRPITAEASATLSHVVAVDARTSALR